MLLLYCLPPCVHINAWSAVLLCVVLPAVLYAHALSSCCLMPCSTCSTCSRMLEADLCYGMLLSARYFPVTCRRSGGASHCCASLLLLWSMARMVVPCEDVTAWHVDSTLNNCMQGGEAESIEVQLLHCSKLGRKRGG